MKDQLIQIVQENYTACNRYSTMLLTVFYLAFLTICGHIYREGGEEFD